MSQIILQPSPVYCPRLNVTNLAPNVGHEMKSLSSLCPVMRFQITLSSSSNHLISDIVLQKMCMYVLNIETLLTFGTNVPVGEGNVTQNGRSLCDNVVYDVSMYV